ncbi:hypothetical protein CEP51_015916 [Fusarium floridanum]|uniref:Uncharacterized protein n=1 Tax=Fusarium floridanum TaxID=1325733 RepID=A0A428P0L4_9HYPO|nr:hypothetical protein CEP51_015916 [Fusarium floridanum]
MSGTDGFYKYRCKHFYTHNCPSWVWVNNTPCASCLLINTQAHGRDDEPHLSSWTYPGTSPFPKSSAALSSTHALATTGRPRTNQAVHYHQFL